MTTQIQWTAYQTKVEDMNEYDTNVQAAWGISDEAIVGTEKLDAYECKNTESPLHFVNKDAIAQALATVLNCKPEFDGGLWAQSLDDYYGEGMWRAPATDYTNDELNSAGTIIAALQKIKAVK